MKENFEPINTEMGVISGRDAIYLDSVDFDYAQHIVRLTGEINGNLCSVKSGREWIKHSLTFSGVLDFRMTELDFSVHAGASSFDRVINSNLLNALRKNDSGEKLTAKHKHYVLLSFDDVFNIVCDSYNLTLNQ